MAYTAWSVVFGEQPTAAKWNQLGTNDAGFKDGTNFDNDIIKSKHLDWAAIGGGDSGGIWWEELGRHTLSSNANQMEVTAIPARKYLRFLIVAIGTGGAVSVDMQFNNDVSATSYGYAVSTQTGGADGSATTSRVVFDTNVTTTAKVFCDAVNIANREKLIDGLCVDGETLGGANIPTRRLVYGKWANTAAQISSVKVSTTSNNYASGSEIVVLGHN